ncbi:MAG: tRNA methyl transferase PRC-barrel domain-containing protein [Ruthenibacterium lactatiformans]
MDSSVCIQILRDRFGVQAVVIRFSPAHDAAVRAAQTVARQLGVPLIEEDCTEEFEQQVVEPFCAQYCAGRTPSPCVLCNPRVKFAALARVADRLGIRYIATGHYARVTEENGLYYVRAAVSPERDQSYMLYGLPQNILARLCLPVGEFEKSDIREMAASARLASADAPDSQEICFIPDGDYAAYIAARGLVPLQGRFIGPDGEDLGPHKGVWHYTVGQRKGLNIATASSVRAAIARTATWSLPAAAMDFSGIVLTDAARADGRPSCLGSATA